MIMEEYFVVVGPGLFLILVSEEIEREVPE